MNLYKFTLPAIIRAVSYFLPILLGMLFAWIASQGWGVYDEAAGTLTITLSIAELVGAAVVFLGAPSLALTALFKGWKSRVGDLPVKK